VELTHEDKMLFPADDITKGDIIDYYHTIADYMIPCVRNRPVAMQRFTHDIEHEGFYQKEAGSYFPDWIEQVKIKNQDGSTVHYVLCNNKASLVYLANQGVLVYHVWPTTIDDLKHPDHMIFDLDPSGHASFTLVRFAALQIKELLDDLGLTNFIMTTGSRGVHILVPLKRTQTFDQVRACAHAIAQQLVALYPEKLTLQMSKAKRGNRIFLDVIRNTYGHLSVAPYSVRALPGAPIATPISWDELLNKRVKPQQYTIKNIFRRLARIDDPWADFNKKKHDLSHVVKKLEKL